MAKIRNDISLEEYSITNLVDTDKDRPIFGGIVACP